MCLYSHLFCFFELFRLILECSCVFCYFVSQVFHLFFIQVRFECFVLHLEKLYSYLLVLLTLLHYFKLVVVLFFRREQAPLNLKIFQHFTRLVQLNSCFVDRLLVKVFLRRFHTLFNLLKISIKLFLQYLEHLNHFIELKFI